MAFTARLGMPSRTVAWRPHQRARARKVKLTGYYNLIEHLHRLLPGILLCVAITGVAILFQAVEVRFVGQAYLEALVLAILLGVAVRTAWVPTRRFIPGLRFSAKFLLECAVVMLGASVSVATSWRLARSSWSASLRSWRWHSASALSSAV
jgi:hypothetical protein